VKDIAVTDNKDRVRLLLRVATKLSGPSDGPDRADILRLADELLSGSRSVERAANPRGNGLALPLDIFVTYKHRKYSARLEPGWVVSYEGGRYPTPSAAARAVTGNTVNGWRFWKFADPYSDRHAAIESLRESTGVFLAQSMASTAGFVEGTIKGVDELDAGQRFRLAPLA
jgi:hypothetical protein